MYLPKRRLQRLLDWDYNKNGMYFVTICTQNRKNYLATIISGELILSNVGRMVSDKLMEGIPSYPNVLVDKYVVMPNHVHAILYVQHNSEPGNGGTTQGSFPTGISGFVQRFKTLTTRLYMHGVNEGKYPPFEKRFWQKSFYDHIIRDDEDYRKHWRYIDENPVRWREDDYFSQ